MEASFKRGFEKTSEGSEDSKFVDAAEVFMEGSSLAAIAGIGAMLATVALNQPTKDNKKKEIQEFVAKASKNNGTEIDPHFEEDLPYYKSEEAIKWLGEPNKKVLGAFMTSRPLYEEYSKGLEKNIPKGTKAFEKERLALREDYKNKNLWQKMTHPFAVGRANNKFMELITEESEKAERKAVEITEGKRGKEKGSVVKITSSTPRNIVSHEVGHAINAKDRTAKEETEQVSRMQAMAAVGTFAPPAAFMLTKNKYIRALSAAVPMLASAPLLYEEATATLKGGRETARQTGSKSEGAKDIIKNIAPFLTYLSGPLAMSLVSGAAALKK